MEKRLIAYNSFASGVGATVESVEITDGTILDADVNASAAIAATKIHDGSVSNTEFGYLNGVTSAIQTQIDAKASIAPRVISAASYTTDTGTSLNVDSCDEFVITAQAGALLFNAPSGTPAQGRDLTIRIKDDGTGRALTYNAIFRAIGVTLPTTTVANKTHYIGCKYNSTDTKWDVLAVAQEA